MISRKCFDYLDGTITKIIIGGKFRHCSRKKGEIEGENENKVYSKLREKHLRIGRISKVEMVK